MKYESEAPALVKARPTLVVLRDTERSLRTKTLDTVTPILPAALADRLGEAAIVADTTLDTLAAIDLDTITEAELQPARIRMGLLFVGLGALSMVCLLLFLNTLHPQLSPAQQVIKYWHQYIWFVSIGVAGMFMLGRETLRPKVEVDSCHQEPQRFWHGDRLR